MSKIALSPNASGTGVFTIESPNSNTDRTLTLPDEAGTVLTSASTVVYPKGVPAFSAYQSSAQSLSSGVFTNIQCQTEHFDTNGCFNNTGSTVTLNGISTPAYAFAPNVAGYYQFNFHLNCTLGTSQELITSIYKNGSSVSYVSDVIGGLTRSSNGSYLIYCNGTSDYIQMYGYINTNTTTSLAFFQGFMVRAA